MLEVQHEQYMTGKCMHISTYMNNLHMQSDPHLWKTDLLQLHKINKNLGVAHPKVESNHIILSKSTASNI
jgi:hypothetical protein